MRDFGIVNPKRRYFGTDGVRGRVGVEPITASFFLKLGWAMGRVLNHKGGRAVLIGKDTRISGYMIESALEAGLSASGTDIRLLGPMPTPAVAYLTRTMRACGGIVISASHNPYFDNGVKFFSEQGTKLADALETAIESAVEASMDTAEAARLGKARRIEDASGRYVEFCKSTFPEELDLNGLAIVLDCANGATYQVAPQVFRELGAAITAIGVEPNGLNINDNCGSTSPGQLATAVRTSGADLGIAFDGDGDRCIFVDGSGAIVDGDELLFIIARDRLEEGSLDGGVVGTVMSNLGLERALTGLGIPFQRALVGDRHVYDALAAQGWYLGGESSGHIMCLDHTTTGDGIISALQVLAVLRRAAKPLAQLRGGMQKYPQRMTNIRLDAPVDLDLSEPIRRAVRDIERRLGTEGRVILRPSGTEPVVRITLEGPDPAQIEALSEELSEVVRSELARRTA